MARPSATGALPGNPLLVRKPSTSVLVSQHDGAMVDERTDVTRAAAERRRERFLRQAAAAVEVLRSSPDDWTARGALGEAVQQLGADAPEWLEEARLRLLVPAPPELPIRTERLLLRRPRMEDLDALHAWYGDEEVARYLLTPVLSREDLEAELVRRTSDEADPTGGLSLVVELEGEVIGDLVLSSMAPSWCQGELGWTLNPSHGGRGFATEAARALLDLAFGHYRLQRVHADLDARNEPSRLLCERLGMRKETHALRDYWSKGEWTDSLRYALLREEYDALPETVRQRHPGAASIDG
jgi:RimJ/RimL family protein N-acetyltransferase